MAQRRMFSLKIVDSDAFLDMPTSTQLLYFHLSMRADDDGFVGNPKKITKMVGTNDDDLKLLLAKRFLLTFDSGVVVIKHWKIHNYIQNDRYSASQYIEEKNLLITKENGSYTECIQDVSKVDTQVRIELGKSKVRDRLITEQSSVHKDIVEVIESFKDINSSFKKWFGNKTQRKAIERLLETKGKSLTLKVVSLLPQTNKMNYMPTITTPIQLEDKWSALEANLSKKKEELKEKSNKTKIYGL